MNKLTIEEKRGTILDPEILKILSARRELFDRDSRLNLDSSNKDISDNIQLFPTLAQLFEATSAQFPDRVAISDAEELSTTYGEINQAANRWAHYFLETCELTPGRSQVGLFLPMSVDYVTLQLALFKIGVAFVPLTTNPKTPTERLLKYAKDPAISLIISNQHLQDHSFVQQVTTRHLIVEDIQAALAKQATHNPDLIISHHCLAYIMNSSGSTGEPKRALICHKGLEPFMRSLATEMQIEPDDCMAVLADIAFDAHIAEIWCAFIQGAKIQIIPDQDRLNIQQYETLYRNVTHGMFTPSILSRLDEKSLHKLRVILSTGEVLTNEQLKKWTHKRRIIDGYGPMEATIGFYLTIYENGKFSKSVCTEGMAVTLCHFDEATWESNPLQPITPTNCNDQGITKTGEIYIHGFGLARGYTNAKLTSAAFVEVLDIHGKNWRAFKSGDLGHYNKDGQLKIVGRTDRQFKIHGRLIHASEIESIIEQTGLVDFVYVDGQPIDMETVSSDETQKRKIHHIRLFAYIVFKENVPHDVFDLSYYLNTHYFPDITPAYWLILEQKPDVTGNLKTASALLQKHTAKKLFTTGVSETLDPKYSNLCDIWKEVLLLQNESEYVPRIDDNFLHLGGSSLLAADLIETMNTKLAKNVLVANFLDNPTLEFLIGHFYLPDNGKTDLMKRIYSPTLNKPELEPIVFIHSLLGNAEEDYNALFQYLKPENRSIYAISAPGLNEEYQPNRMTEIVAHYLKGIKNVAHSEQSPILVGWSAGGTILVAIANELEREGLSAIVLLLDSPAPEYYDLADREGFSKFITDLYKTKLDRTGYSNASDLRRNLKLKKQHPIKQIGTLFNELITISQEGGAPGVNKLKTIRSLLLALCRNEFTRYPRNVHLWKAEKPLKNVSHLPNNKRLCWPDNMKFASPIETLPGNHHTMISQDPIELAIKITKFADHQSALLNTKKFDQQFKSRYASLPEQVNSSMLDDILSQLPKKIKHKTNYIQASSDNTLHVLAEIVAYSWSNNKLWPNTFTRVIYVKLSHLQNLPECQYHHTIVDLILQLDWIDSSGLIDFPKNDLLLHAIKKLNATDILWILEDDREPSHNSNSWESRLRDSLTRHGAHFVVVGCAASFTLGEVAVAIDSRELINTDNLPKKVIAKTPEKINQRHHIDSLNQYLLNQIESYYDGAYAKNSFLRHQTALEKNYLAEALVTISSDKSTSTATITTVCNNLLPKRVLVHGATGTGKTALLRHIATQQLKNNNFDLVLFIANDHPYPEGSSLLQLIRTHIDHIFHRTGERSKIDSIINFLMPMKPRLLIILDGFANTYQLAQELNHDGYHFILSADTNTLEQSELIDTTITPAGLSLDSAYRYIEAYRNLSPQDSPLKKGMECSTNHSKTPSTISKLLLTQLTKMPAYLNAWCYLEAANSIPEFMVNSQLPFAILDQALTVKYEKLKQEHPTETQLIANCRTMLSQIAFDLFLSDHNTITTQTLEARYGSKLASIEKLLLFGVFTIDDTSCYFAQKPVQEVLAVRHLYNMLRRSPKKLAKLFKKNNYSAKLYDFLPSVAQLCRDNWDDLDKFFKLLPNDVFNIRKTTAQLECNEFRDKYYENSEQQQYIDKLIAEIPNSKAEQSHTLCVLLKKVAMNCPTATITRHRKLLDILDDAKFSHSHHLILDILESCLLNEQCFIRNKTLKRTRENLIESLSLRMNRDNKTKVTDEHLIRLCLLFIKIDNKPKHHIITLKVLYENNPQLRETILNSYFNLKHTYLDVEQQLDSEKYLVTNVITLIKSNNYAATTLKFLDQETQEKIATNILVEANRMLETISPHAHINQEKILFETKNLLSALTELDPKTLDKLDFDGTEALIPKTNILQLKRLYFNILSKTTKISDLIDKFHQEQETDLKLLLLDYIIQRFTNASETDQGLILKTIEDIINQQLYFSVILAQLEQSREITEYFIPELSTRIWSFRTLHESESPTQAYIEAAKIICLLERFQFSLDDIQYTKRNRNTTKMTKNIEFYQFKFSKQLHVVDRILYDVNIDLYLRFQLAKAYLSYLNKNGAMEQFFLQYNAIKLEKSSIVSEDMNTSLKTKFSEIFEKNYHNRVGCHLLVKNLLQDSSLRYIDNDKAREEKSKARAKIWQCFYNYWHKIDFLFDIFIDYLSSYPGQDCHELIPLIEPHQHLMAWIAINRNDAPYDTLFNSARFTLSMLLNSSAHYWPFIPKQALLLKAINSEQIAILKNTQLIIPSENKLEVARVELNTTWAQNIESLTGINQESSLAQAIKSCNIEIEPIKIAQKMLLGSMINEYRRQYVQAVTSQFSCQTIAFAQTNLTQSVADFLILVLDNCQRRLNKTIKTQIEFIALGSLASCTMHHYSDFEFIILVENNTTEVQEYLVDLLELFYKELKYIIKIDRKASPSIDLKNKTIHSFYGTAEQVLDYFFSKAIERTTAIFDIDYSFSLLTTRLLATLVNGKISFEGILIDEFQALVSQRVITDKYRETHFSKHLNHINKNIRLYQDLGKYNIKELFQRTLFLFVMDTALASNYALSYQLITSEIVSNEQLLQQSTASHLITWLNKLEEHNILNRFTRHFYQVLYCSFIQLYCRLEYKGSNYIHTIWHDIAILESRIFFNLISKPLQKFFEDILSKSHSADLQAPIDPISYYLDSTIDHSEKVKFMNSLHYRLDMILDQAEDKEAYREYYRELHKKVTLTQKEAHRKNSRELDNEVTLLEYDIPEPSKNRYSDLNTLFFFFGRLVNEKTISEKKYSENLERYINSVKHDRNTSTHNKFSPNYFEFCPKHVLMQWAYYLIKIITERNINPSENHGSMLTDVPYINIFMPLLALVFSSDDLFSSAAKLIILDTIEANFAVFEPSTKRTIHINELLNRAFNHFDTDMKINLLKLLKENNLSSHINLEDTVESIILTPEKHHEKIKKLIAAVNDSLDPRGYHEHTIMHKIFQALLYKHCDDQNSLVKIIVISKKFHVEIHGNMLSSQLIQCLLKLFQLENRDQLHETLTTILINNTDAQITLYQALIEEDLPLHTIPKPLIAERLSTIVARYLAFKICDQSEVIKARTIELVDNLKIGREVARSLKDNLKDVTNTQMLRYIFSIISKYEVPLDDACSNSIDIELIFTLLLNDQQELLPVITSVLNARRQIDDSLIGHLLTEEFSPCIEVITENTWEKWTKRIENSAIKLLSQTALDSDIQKKLLACELLNNLQSEIDINAIAKNSLSSAYFELLSGIDDKGDVIRSRMKHTLYSLNYVDIELIKGLIKLYDKEKFDTIPEHLWEYWFTLPNRFDEKLFHKQLLNKPEKLINKLNRCFMSAGNYLSTIMHLNRIDDNYTDIEVPYKDSRYGDKDQYPRHRETVFLHLNEKISLIRKPKAWLVNYQLKNRAIQFKLNCVKGADKFIQGGKVDLSKKSSLIKQIDQHATRNSKNGKLRDQQIRQDRDNKYLLRQLDSDDDTFDSKDYTVKTHAATGIIQQSNSYKNPLSEKPKTAPNQNQPKKITEYKLSGAIKLHLVNDQWHVNVRAKKRLFYWVSLASIAGASEILASSSLSNKKTRKALKSLINSHTIKFLQEQKPNSVSKPKLTKKKISAAKKVKQPKKSKVQRKSETSHDTRKVVHPIKVRKPKKPIHKISILPTLTKTKEYIPPKPKAPIPYLTTPQVQNKRNPRHTKKRPIPKNKNYTYFSPKSERWDISRFIIKPKNEDSQGQHFRLEPIKIIFPKTTGYPLSKVAEALTETKQPTADVEEESMSRWKTESYPFHGYNSTPKPDHENTSEEDSDELLIIGPSSNILSSIIKVDKAPKNTPPNTSSSSWFSSLFTKSNDSVIPSAFNFSSLFSLAESTYFETLQRQRITLELQALRTANELTLKYEKETPYKLSPKSVAKSRNSFFKNKQKPYRPSKKSLRKARQQYFRPTKKK